MDDPIVELRFGRTMMNFGVTARSETSVGRVLRPWVRTSEAAKAPIMPNPPRKLAFVLAATDHGTLIVNRFDRHHVGPNQGYGVGFQLLETATDDQDQINVLLTLLDLRRQHYGDGAVMIDCGANVGV